MKITCALSQSQSEKLYKTIYKSLTEALKAEKPFSAQEYMANLFDKIADKKDEDTAVKFLQQVPSIIRTIAAKPAFDNLDIKLDPIKELSLKFKDEAEGFNEVQKYFKPQVSQRAKLALIRAKQNNALLAEQVDPPTEVKDPVRLRPFSSNVSTMQLLIPINPNDKDKLLKEENDPAKKRIFSAIETIKKEAVLSDSTDVLSPISFQGKTLKLKPILLTELRETHENQIDKTTLSEVIRAGAIKSQGTNKEGVEGLNRIALVITDESGNYLYFNEEGEMVTEEEGGGIVYQFMRDVRTDNGVYRLTNMYGSETSVKTPADIAEQMGITEEAARKLQQEEFKDLYKVKEATLKGNGPLLYLTGLTPGVKQSATQKNITLQNLRSLPFVTNATFKTITPKMIYGTKEIATITLNGQEYNLDRPNLPIEFANGQRQPSQLIKKIAAALANPNISNQEKYEYVSQFLSDKASEYTRRHTLSYDEATDTLVFGYNEKTYKQGSGNKLSFINEELTGKESIIEDVLLNAASDDRGNMYSAKMTYNAKALNDNRYRDYDMETNTISDEFTPYIPFLETLPNSKVKITEEDAPEFYNSHMNFSIPDEFTKEIEADFKNPDPINVSETPVEQKWEWPPITQDDSINNAIAPDNTTDPADDFSDFMFRKGADLNGVTEEQIKAAEEWWNSSPLSKYLDFKTMVNIVNSNVYARFIGYASVLNGKYGGIEISRTGTMVDVYHEAWHAFSQIFLTKEQREKLYKEIAKQPGTFTLLDGTVVAFKDANYLQLEEYLGEDFRSYGIDQSTKKGQPTRNTLFRRILNFIRDLFSSRSTKDRLFKELYFAKSNPKFLKKYSPNIDTTSFKKLNRGVVSLTDPTIDALNRQDAELISNSIDSYISEIIDAAANARGNKSGSISMLLGDKNKQAFYTRVRKDFETKLANARTSYEAIQNDPEKAMDAAKLLNKIRIFQAALDNFGDAKGGLVKYHLENTTFNLLRQKYIEVEEEVEIETPVENNVEDSISQTSTPEESQPESVIKDSKIGKKSLLDLASKETVYILKSLHKLENGKPVYNELGYKELANFTQSWNNLMRAVNGEKNPEKIYENIKQAGLEVYPEFKQLLNSKLPKPSEIIKAENVNDKISQNKLLTNFWQDVQKTRVTYLQTTIFENGIAEVTKASIETASLANKFEAKFKGDLTNAYVVRSTENNIPMLNMDKVIEDFGKDGVLITDKSFEFARAIGLYLDDLRMIKNELKKDQRSIQEYGLPYIYKTISDINKASKKQNLSSEGREAITAFRLNPIRELMKGIPESVLGKEVSQKNKIDKILGLQAKYGVDSSNFAVLNAERNLVFEHIEDHSVSMIVFALNKATNMKELWTEGSEFEYLSYLNPKINSFTNRSQTINSLFDIASDMEKRVGRSLQLFVNSGTQLENGDGTNTTSLDAHGKFLQELHSMLKGGVQEFMRHASKSSSFGARIEGGVIGGVGKGSDTRLWVDLDKFALGTANNYLTKTHMIPYIAAELERINKFKSNKDLFKKYAGYNRPMPDGTMAGENFTAFDNVLTKETKDEILEKVTDPNMRLEDYLKTDPELAKKIANDVDAYFEFQTDDLLDFYEEAEYMSPDLLERLRVFNLSEDEATRVLMKAYAVNAWVHNFEMGNLFYGDLVQYNHEKEELHKRNTGSTSGGLKFRTDAAIKALLTDINSKVSYAATLPGMETLTYTGKFNTAILQDIERNSVYVKQIEEALRKDYEERFANSKMPKDKIQAEIDRRVQKEVAKYKRMEEGDGQGWITFDAYRSLKMASGQWSAVQEELFKKVINNEPVKASDVVEMFPAYKLQNYGHLADTALPVMAMHKFALAPMIPTMIKGSDLENLHMQMMKNNIQYVTFQTGSKVGSVTSEVNSKGKAVADKIYADEEQKSLLSSIKFTPNTIYLEYLKDVTQVPVSFKGKTVFATQLRKLILSNLYDRGILDKHSDLVKDYESTVDEYGNLLKMELLNDIGYEYKDGKYIGNFTEFLKVIQAELNRRDLPEHHVEFVNANPDNSLKTDLSLHLKSDDIEKILVALMEKRLVRQKIKGEALVQVSSAMTNGLWDNQVKFDKANEDEERKYMGSNNLPFYNPTADGTSAMKVAIALQGDFVNLLNAKHNDGEPIGTRERLNEMIKDDKWMAENGKSVSLSAVRIPVQGLNSMEYMQVWEFLDPAAGNIIIPPSEIVAKSGADFDVDKLTTFMPAISKDGKFIESELDNEAIKRLISQNKETAEGKAMISRVISQQKAALENKLITSINNILRLPENYAALVRPNDTYLLKDDVADVLEDKVTDYNRFNNYHGESQRPGVKAKRSISPTRTLEPLYNLHKHDANMIGKAVLGLVAIYNALHPVYNSLDAKMPKQYLDTYYDKGLGKYVEGKNPISSRMLMPHNKTAEGNISLSDIYTADGVDLISDLYSQLINGAVDVEKDAWIFFIQGNMELAPMLLTMFKAGVPREYAIKFLSQPMIREYAKELRLLGGSYADLVADPLEDTKTGKNKRAAISVLERFGVINAPSYLKSDLKTHLALSALTKKSGILNEEGQFDVALLDKMLEEDVSTDKYKNHQLAVFLHFLEMQNQFSGFQDLLRLSNPDTTTSKTTQEILLRNTLLNDIMKNSKVEPSLVSKLTNESILGTFYDNEIITQLIEPLFPLKNNPTVTKAIITLLTKKASEVKNIFGYGDDGKRIFISQYKNGLVNYLFQNAMYNYTRSDNNLLNIPSELIDKYFTGDVFFQNLDYSFADDILTLIEQNLSLKEKYNILQQLAKPELKEGQQILTLNDSKLLKNGALAESYYTNLKELADPNVKKSSDPEKNLYISNMFKLLPLMAIYQNGVGFSKYGFNEALPFDDFLAIMNPVSADFIDNKNKNTDLLNVFNGIKEPKNRFFRNFVQIRPEDVVIRTQATQPTVRKTYSGKVTSLQPNQIFVFGSNEGSSKGAAPTHGAGSAKIARDNFGAVQGQSRGLQGQSYAIVTKKFYDVKKSSTPQEIIEEIKGLYKYAKQNPTKEFLVSDYSESNLNGYSGQEMADMFNAAGPIPSNIVFNENFDKLVGITQPTVQPVGPVSQTNKPKGVEVKEGIYVNQGALTKEEQLELFNYLKPFLEEQADKSLKATQGSKMIGLGLRWDYTSNNPGKTPINIPDPIIKNPRYGYYDQSVNGQPLGQITPRFRELMKKATGVDMTNYDGAIINLYEKDTFISSHNDVDESKSAIKYPVIGINLGGKGNFSIEPRDGSKIQTLDLQAGTGYIFGVDGVNRKVFHRTFPTPQDSFLPELTTKIDGKTYPAGSYRVTITMRRIMPLTQGIPQAPSIVSTQPTAAVVTDKFAKKNIFTVTPQVGVSDNKAKAKASIATQYIGFGEDIVGKDGKRSSTQLYREQAGSLANTGNYSANDVIFVSVPGLRGNAEVAKREQDKTIKEAIKAVEAGATILTDNKSYIDSNPYNTGEKRLYANMEAKGYNYSEITVDGQLIGTWSKATTQPTETSKTFVPGLKKINQVKPESISNVKEMSFNELGTFTFTVGESEYQVTPKKNDAGDIKFNIYKYDDNTKLYNLVSNPKTRRSLSTKEASDFLSKNLPEDFIKFVINLYNNRKHINLNLPSKQGPTKLNPNPIATEASSLMDSYLFQKPMREQTYDGSDWPILLTLEEVNRKFEEYYSDELRSGIKKYLEPFAKDQLIKSIEAEEEKLNILNERGSTNPAKISKMFLEDLKNALKNFTSTQPAAPVQAPGKTITYTPQGKKTQTYTIRGNQIFNSAGLEVFKGDSVDRNKIFANLAVSEGRAVVVEHNGSKYVVNNRNQIISGTTGKMMQWAENNGDRVAILKKAEAKFKPTELDVTSDTVKEAEETPTPAASNINARTFVLNSTEFQSWIKGELSKNPNLDVNKALDYYIKCKGL